MKILCSIKIKKNQLHAQLLFFFLQNKHSFLIYIRLNNLIEKEISEVNYDMKHKKKKMYCCHNWSS